MVEQRTTTPEQETLLSPREIREQAQRLMGRYLSSFRNSPELAGEPQEDTFTEEFLAAQKHFARATSFPRENYRYTIDFVHSPTQRELHMTREIQEGNQQAQRFTEGVTLIVDSPHASEARRKDEIHHYKISIEGIATSKKQSQSAVQQVEQFLEDFEKEGKSAHGLQR